MPVRVVEGVVQHYAWGDREFIPKLLGVAGRGRPWAELWLGTHRNGPTVLDDGTPLSELTGELPYLLKVLSAAEPLSLQVHPSEDQAEKGFETGVFGDPFAKPELLVALTEFEAFCGVRSPASTLHLLERLEAWDLHRAVNEHGAAEAMRALFEGEVSARGVVDTCEHADGPEADWVRRLAGRFGGDEPAVASVLLLNYVALQPGQALHITAGNLHSYLNGSGVELMGASDNVVRGGLTDKPVDVELLLETVDTTPLAEPVLDVHDGRYPLPEAGVVLVRLEPGDSHTAVGHELAIVMDGTTLYLSPGSPIHADSVTYVVTV